MTDRDAPDLASPAVTRIDQPLTTPTRIPVPDGWSLFRHPDTLEAMSEINAKQHALEAYMRARAGARYTAPPWHQAVPDTLGQFLEASYADAAYRSYRSRHNVALMVPGWVVDALAGERFIGVPLIEIPMRPTAPYWEAIGVATISRGPRTPQLVMGNYRPFARYRCPALPEHLETFEAIEAARYTAEMHERRYAATGAPTNETPEALAAIMREHAPTVTGIAAITDAVRRASAETAAPTEPDTGEDT